MTASGRSVLRIDGIEKATGATRYVDDLALPDLWIGRTVRSHVPHGRIRAIRFDPAFDWERVVRITAADIPGKNLILMIDEDQPVLAADVVKHVGEPIVLVAAATAELAAEAARHIEVDIEPLPARLTFDDTDGTIRALEIVRGDVTEALRSAGVVVHGLSQTGAQEHVYIEPQGMIASIGDDGVLAVRGSMQCPYYVQEALEVIFGWPRSRVRIVQTPTGGGFGGKEDFPSVIAAHAALLAWRAGRPVKIVYDRREDLIATTKRHPARIRHTTGVSATGELLALDIEIELDGGAYSTLSPAVLSRAMLHATGAYACPNTRIRGRVVRTHMPPRGAFRGFGAPQVLFAMEMQVERVAREIGADPVALRRRWLLNEEHPTLPCGQNVTAPAGHEVLARALAEADTRPLPPPGAAKRRGRGVSVYVHGAGYNGAGELRVPARVVVRLADDGCFEVITASTEIGQGTLTMFSQIAADELSVPVDQVRVPAPDTAYSPDSGGTNASRTCMVVGRLVADAARGIARELRVWANELGIEGSLVEIAAARIARAGTLTCERVYEAPADITWDEEHHRGDAYPAYAWGACVADVDVDLDTGEVDLMRLVTAVEAGRIINPMLAEGQIEGGVVQASGWALLEEVRERDGVLENDRLSTYIIPTTMDVPPLETILVQPADPRCREPKGLGELPMDGPAPAIAAAVSNAVGALIVDIPIRSERILDALEHR